MAITNIDGLISGTRAFQSLLKASATAEGAGTWHSLWKVAGMPPAGANPPLFSAGSGYVPTNGTTGCVPFTNPAGGAFSYLMRAIAAGATVGTLLVYDRIWHCSGFGTVSTSLQSITTPGTISRDAGGSSTGAGVELWLEVYTAPGATAANWTITYCVDSDTECLTRRGWMRRSDLREDDEILAWNPETQRTRWERPSEVFVRADYQGDVFVFPGLGGLITTPDHRWPVRLRRGASGDRIRVRTSETLGTDDFLLRGAPHDAPEKETYPDAFVRLVAWYFTEGSLRREGQGISLCQSQTANSDYVDAIRGDLVGAGAKDSSGVALVGNQHTGRERRVGLWYRENSGIGAARADQVVRWTVTGTLVDDVIACCPGKAKVPTMAFLTSLTDRQLAMFVDTCLQGDGTPSRGMFYQHDRERMDAFMVAAVLAGWAPSVDRSGTACALRLKQGRGKGRSSIGHLRRTRLWYRGEVWCPVTQSGHWVARRNGKVFITGNTDELGNGAQTAVYAHPANAETIGQTMPVALAAGDFGVRAVASFQASGTSGTAGDIGITLRRRLAMIPLTVANVATVQDFAATGLPRIYDNSCIELVVMCSTTNTGILLPQLTFAQG